MKIYFHLPYKTAPKEHLRVSLWTKKNNQWLRQYIPMQSTDNLLWNGTAELTLNRTEQIMYCYQVLSGEKMVRQEWNTLPRIVSLNFRKNVYYFYDWWRELPAQSWLYSTALAPEVAVVPPKEFAASIILRANIPGLKPGQTPYVCGSQPILGSWNPDKAVAMKPSGVNEWAACLDASVLKFPVDYKFIIKDEHHHVLWELDGNRVLSGRTPIKGETVIYSGLTPRFALTPVKAAGVVLPVFSIRSEEDWGVGDFGSLKKLVNWVAYTGQKIIQILPVNDTSLTKTWQDSYPYNSVSVYAFHPMYADMSALPNLPEKQEKDFQARREQLNKLPQIDYEAVNQLKMERLRLAYEQEGRAVLSSAEFKAFWEENDNWLPTYAMFSALRDAFGTPEWQRWPKYSSFSENNLYAFYSTNSKDRQKAYFYFYVQFVLHTQLLEAHQYAHSKGVALKGDIPIGVSPYSADAWAEPELFHLNAQAGAPPDDFSETGQNWGFPTYNWDNMAKDKYAWWRRRFMHMTRYFDAYRIDHVLGFFRIWEIPLHSVQGLLGQFSPALPLSKKEIDSFGFLFQSSHLQPYITDKVLGELFGSNASQIKDTYLEPTLPGSYRLRPEYETQRQIEQAFADKQDPQSREIMEGLFTLCNNVLFVVDSKDPELYHPRISAFKTSAYQALEPEQQNAYMHMYSNYFFHRQDEFWKQQALKKLPALTQSTSMLCCAEDLGMIPNCVPEVMHSLQMLSLEIQRMPKELGRAFARPEHYPYLSVATPSTHDMSVLRGWWTENKELTNKFWRDVLHKQGAAPNQAPSDVCEQILQMHFKSPSMLCMISFQDLTSMDNSLRAKDPKTERINVPANPKHYWRYRMHISLEQLMKKDNFNKKLKQMIQAAGR